MLGAFVANSRSDSTVMFRYYLQGGDTEVPSGLYAGLCHAFLVNKTLSVELHVSLKSSVRYCKIVILWISHCIRRILTIYLVSLVVILT